MDETMKFLFWIWVCDEELRNKRNSHFKCDVQRKLHFTTHEIQCSIRYMCS